MKCHIKHKLKDENPTIWIGKEGLTPQLTTEVEKQLQKNKMLKIRILPAALTDTDTAQTIATQTATQTDASLVEVRGHVFILFRKRRQTTQNTQQPK